MNVKQNLKIHHFDSDTNPFLKAARHILDGYELGDSFEFVASYEWVAGLDRVSGQSFISANVFVATKHDVPELDEYKGYGNLFDACFTTWLNDDQELIGRNGTTLRIAHNSSVIDTIEPIGKCSDEVFMKARQMIDNHTHNDAMLMLDRIMAQKHSAT